MESLPAPYILLADQDRVLCKSLEQDFADAGWRYDIVCDGESAVKAAANAKYDVIIADVEIPGLGGAELLRKLREHQPDQAIIITGRAATSSVEQVVNLLRGGAVDFITKPVLFEAVDKSVARVLAERRRRKRSDKTLLRSMVCCSASFSSTSRELGDREIKLPLLNDLYTMGEIALDTKLRLELAFQEALANSLEHGNLELESAWKEEFGSDGSDRYTKMKCERLADDHYGNRRVEIFTEYKDDTITIRIKDQGPGFLLKSENDNDSFTEVPLCYGRGLQILHGIMDRVKYRKRGTELIMSKVLRKRG